MTQNKTINEQIEELKKGCGEPKSDYDKTYCGDKKGNLCPECEIKLSTLQEAKKMFLEEIKSMRKHKDTKLIHNFNGEEIDYLISAKELKSKIGGEDGYK